jgi:hypothetical protein
VADYFTELRQTGTVRKAIICIPGNHELTLDHKHYDKVWQQFLPPGQTEKLNVGPAREALTRSCTYLEDEAFSLGSIKFYGSPCQPKFWGAFNVPRDYMDDKWDQILSDTDVLITHGPPLGRGDVTSTNDRVGCVSLMKHVQSRIRPRLHVFGHVHEGYGVSYDGVTLYVNASILSNNNKLNHCIVIDLPYDHDLPAMLVLARPDA